MKSEVDEHGEVNEVDEIDEVDEVDEVYDITNADQIGMIGGFDTCGFDVNWVVKVGLYKFYNDINEVCEVS